MATFTKRRGKYQVTIRRKGFATVCRTFHKRGDAEEWARHMEIKADRGDLPSPIRVLDAYTLKSILKRYKDEITVKKRSANTEVYILDAFMRQGIASMTLAQITTAHFSTYRDKRLKQVKAGTVNREFTIIKHALDIASREWDVPLNNNPLSNLKKLKVNNARTRRMSQVELDALQEAAKESRNPYVMPLIRFAVATGMRRGEILSLRWDDVDYNNKTLHIGFAKWASGFMCKLCLDNIRLIIQFFADRGTGKGAESVRGHAVFEAKFLQGNPHCTVTHRLSRLYLARKYKVGIYMRCFFLLLM